MLKMLKLEIPELAHRDLTSPQFLDGCRRLTRSVLRGTTQIPAKDEWLREVAGDAALTAEELACRLALDRKSAFTRDKTAANAQRIDVVQALRRENKSLLRSPDPAVTEERKAAAKEVLAVLDKHALSAKRRSQAEVSTVVQGLLAETEDQDVQRAIAKTGLGRLFDLLKEAQESYVTITHKEEEAAAIPLAPEATNTAPKGGDAVTPAWSLTADGKPRLARELKQELSDDLALLFKLMARQARKGRDPYALLLAKCGEITAELQQVAKTRDTREKTAEAKRKMTQDAAAGAAVATPSNGNTTTEAASSPRPATDPTPAAPKSTAVPVAGANGDSVLAS